MTRSISELGIVSLLAALAALAAASEASTEFARANYDRSDLRYGSDLTDAVWALNCWPPGGEEGFSDFEYTWVPGITAPDFVLNINYTW